MHRFAVAFLLIVAAAALPACHHAGLTPADQADLDQAIAVVRHPQPGPALFNGPPNPPLQVICRQDALQYQFNPAHAPAWRRLMLDPSADRYARLCAASFLLDSDDARRYIDTQFPATDPRLCYNAAWIVRAYVGEDPTKTWGIDKLIWLLNSRLIDPVNPIDSRSLPASDFPLGDRDDINENPLRDLIGALGDTRQPRAVDPLIAFLQRQPDWGDRAVYSLGQIGDPRAVPALMKAFKDYPPDRENDSFCSAFVELKAKEAVPLLVERLSKVGAEMTAPSWSRGPDRVNSILEALRDLGGPAAIPAIRQFLALNLPPESKPPARRVLAEMTLPDPVPALFELYDHETYDVEQDRIMADLSRYPDARVVARLESIARDSGSWGAQIEAIGDLERVHTKAAMLAMVRLLTAKYAPAHPGTKEAAMTPPEEWSKKLPDYINACLQRCTGQDFGTDAAAWKKWITANVHDP